MSGIRQAWRLFGLAVMVGLTGCLSLSDELRKQEGWVRQGNFPSAYYQASQEAKSSNADTNFWQMEAGTLALFMGDPKAVTEHLDAADNGFNDEARRLYGASVWDQTKALSVNDTLLPYAPEGIDRVFTNFYKAIAYGASGNAAAMRVELNRARQRQYEWFFTCTKQISAMQSGLNAEQQKQLRQAVAQEAGSGPEALNASSVTSLTNATSASLAQWKALAGVGNAYVAHVTGVTRWCAGDASLNDLGLAAALAPRNSFVQEDYAMEKKGEHPENLVWVYVESAMAAHRQERRRTYFYPSVMGRGTGTVTYNVPEMVLRSSLASGFSVNGVGLEPLLDVDQLMQQQFDRDYPGILARQLARIVVRVAVHEAGSAALREHDESGLYTLLFDLLMGGFNIATNDADVRCADLLPKEVWMASLKRPEDGRLQLLADGGLMAEVTLKTRGNTLVWVRQLSYAAPPVIYVIDLEP